MQPLPVIANRYEAQDVLGEGAFARTLRARDRRSGDVVAIKILHPSRMSSVKDFDRFEREAEALARLNHVSIPRYVDHFDTRIEGERVYCIVQEFKQGRTLEELVAGGRRWNEEDAIGLALQVLSILDYLADQSPPIVHRDLKPANLILDPDGTVHLVDFGAVREAVRQTIRAGSTVIGTFGFMPPEQLMGQACHASDLFALGVTLISLLARRPAHTLSTDGFTIPVHDLTLDVSPPFREVLRALVAPRVEDRYQDAAQVRADLERVREGRKPVHLSRLDLAIARRRRREERETARRLRRGSRLLYWMLVGAVLASLAVAAWIGFTAFAGALGHEDDGPPGGSVFVTLSLFSLFGLVCSVLLLGGRYISGAWEPPASSWVEAIATVVEHSGRYAGDRWIPYAVLQWTAADGRVERSLRDFEPSAPEDADAFAVGRQWRLAHPPGDVQHFMFEKSPVDALLPPRAAANRNGRRHG